MLGYVYHWVHEGKFDQHTKLLLKELSRCTSLIKNDPKKYQHMINAIKYSTSLWPLCVSAYEKTVDNVEEKATLEKILIALLA